MKIIVELSKIRQFQGAVYVLCSELLDVELSLVCCAILEGLLLYTT